MTTTHWSRMARLWHLVRPPLRPSPLDGAEYQRAILDLATANERITCALVLGTTPELFALDWPKNASVIAIDGSREMIDHVWPGSRHMAVRGAWTDLPIGSETVDMAVCDGGFGMMSFPHHQARFLGEVGRVLRVGGLFVMRLFAPQGRADTVDGVFARLAANKIPNLDSLKLELWGALHGTPEEGVMPRRVAEAILARHGMLEALAVQRGWPRDHVDTLAFHLRSEARYWLTDADEVVRMASRAGPPLDLVRRVAPDYPLGDCCPILTFRRTG